jgi:hypothetical protein
MTSVEFLNDPERARAYKTWLADPMTKLMRSQALEEARPISLGDNISGERGLYNLAYSAGGNHIIDVIFDYGRLYNVLDPVPALRTEYLST